MTHPDYPTSFVAIQPRRWRSHYNKDVIFWNCLLVEFCRDGREMDLWDACVFLFVAVWLWKSKRGNKRKGNIWRKKYEGGKVAFSIEFTIYPILFRRLSVSRVNIPLDYWCIKVQFNSLATCLPLLPFTLPELWLPHQPQPISLTIALHKLPHSPHHKNHQTKPQCN